MLVSPMVGFAILAALFTVAGLLMMGQATTEKEQASACAFMVILTGFIIALLVMIVI